ncbi:MAG: molybdopterin molybdotransferase MoeA [Bryobacteraceae bacterium]
MPTLHFADARECVIREVRAVVLSSGPPPQQEAAIPIADAAGRVLAEEVSSDRDYPPVARSVRDGFAFRSASVPGSLRIIGEVRAGEMYSGETGAGEAVEIMTGAPVPRGSDAVIMVEHTRREGDSVIIDLAVRPGNAINRQGSEAKAGQVMLKPGRRLGYAEIALLATIGRGHIHVHRRPRVTILATGDEIVEISQTPLPYQVRNSNACALAVQVARAGGVPEVLPVARDVYDSTRGLIERGLRADLLLLSGGVSAGKYDIVERVLADLGAQFFFDRVLIQPGQPLVFGTARGTFFFVLPGNPASTMVTFELFARAAIDLLGGCDETPLPMPAARLTEALRQKTGLMRFLPAHLSADGSQVTPVQWQGSSDVPSLARSNAFLVTEEERETWEAGDWIRVLSK